jgi:hypothetical protein
LSGGRQFMVTDFQQPLELAPREPPGS